MSGIVDDILGVTDEILGLRDDLGATKHLVFILTRTWSGTRLASGTATDTKIQILPTPFIVDFSHDLRVREGGKIKQGDLLLKHISKQSHPNESSIDASSSAKNIKKFYYINNRLYQVISITESYVYWNIQVRKTNKQNTFF